MKIDCKAVEQPESEWVGCFLESLRRIEKAYDFFKIGHLTGNKWCLAFSHEMFHNLLI